MLWATMRLAGTAVEESAHAGTGRSSGPTDGENGPILPRSARTRPSIVWERRKSIDRLMAESGTVDGSRPPGEPGATALPVPIDPADVRQNIEQTRDRLRAKTLGEPGSAQENGASADR